MIILENFCKYLIFLAEEGKIDPEFLNKRNSNRFKRKEFFENFQTRIELRSPFKNKSPLNKKLFPSSLQGSKSDI